MTNEKFTEYTSHIANHYRDYLELKHEVEELEIFVKFYIENYSIKAAGKRMNQGLVNDNSFWIPMRSTFQAIVMMYARIFDSSSERRNAKIFGDRLSNQGAEYHLHMLSVRNQFVAHAGNSDYEKVGFFIGISTEGHLITNTNPIQWKVFGAVEGHFEDKLVPLLAEVRKKITKELEEKERQLQEEISFMEYNQETRDRILNQIITNAGVTKDDINFCKNQKKV